MRLLNFIALAVAAWPSPRPLAQAESAPPPIPEPLAFVHAALVPMDRERVLEDHTLLVRDGRIEAFGPSAEIVPPADARVIDATGCWLMPGLADMHVHAWSEPDLFLFVANGVTAVRNMFGSPMHLGWRDRVRRGELLAPRVHTAGPIIDGDPPVWPGSVVLTDPEQAEEVVAAQARAGYEFLKPYARLSSEVYAALVEAAGVHELPLMGHVPPAVGLERVLSSGQRTIEHLDGWAALALEAGSSVDPRHEAAAWQHADPEALARLAGRCREAGAWNCPTLVVHQKWVQGEEALALLARPEMRYASRALLSSWAPSSPWNYLSRISAEDVAAARAAIPFRMDAVRALRDAGARLLAGTDMGNPYVLPGFFLHEELSNLVRAGLTPYEALRAATADAAECLGAEWGTLAPGRLADLLLLEADPLRDVANAAARRGVALGGRWLTRVELERELEARAGAPQEAQAER